MDHLNRYFLKNDRFSTQRLYLRAISLEDTINLVRWRSSLDVYRYMKTPKPISIQEHLDWYTGYQNNPNEYRAIIVEKLTNQSMGMVGVAWTTEGYELSYYLGEVAFLNKGYATEALQVIIKQLHKFGHKQLILAYVHKDNKASIRLLTKLGFAETAVSRRHFCHEDAFRPVDKSVASDIFLLYTHQHEK